MFKIINNIDNLLKEILYNKKTLLIFYDENSQDSSKIIEILNSHDLDIMHNIILIDKSNYFIKNLHKLNKEYFDDFLQNNFYHNYFNKSFEKLNFLYLLHNNINFMEIKNPKLFFIKNNNFPEICYETVYCANYDTSNFLINLIKKYFSDIQNTKENNEIAKNLYDDINNVDEIKKIEVFI